MIRSILHANLAQQQRTRWSVMSTATNMRSSSYSIRRRNVHVFGGVFQAQYLDFSPSNDNSIQSVSSKRLSLLSLHDRNHLVDTITRSHYCMPTTSQSSQQRCYSTMRDSRGHSRTMNTSLLSRYTATHHQCRQLQARYKSVFVSKHNSSMNISARDIIDYLQNSGVVSSSTGCSRTTSQHVILKECPFCDKPTNNKPDNQHKLYVQIGTGLYFCHRCGAKGSWYDLKMRLGGSNSVDSDVGKGAYATSSASSSAAVNAGARKSQTVGNANSLDSGLQDYIDRRPSFQVTQPLPMPPLKLNAVYSSNLLDNTSSNSCNDDIPPSISSLSDDTNKASDPSATNETAVSCLQYLQEERGLTTKTLRKYGVGKAIYKFPSKANDGKWIQSECVTFPWILRVSDIEYQEQLRGAKYKWEPPSTSKLADDDAAAKSSASETNTITDDVSSTSTGSKTKKSKEDPIDDAKKLRAKRRKEKKLEKEQEQVDISELKKSTHLVRRIKYRSIENKAWQRMDPPGGGWGFFGYHTIPEDAKEIIITEGEYDAMAVYQATKRPAISLPNGCRSLPVEVLPLLEGFDKIILWMDNDAPGQEGAEQFAKKLGLERCYIVRPTKDNCQYIDITDNEYLDGDDDDIIPIPKDANEALLDRLDLNRIIDDAKLIPHERIVDFAGLRENVLHEIMYPDKYVGVPVPSLPGLTNIIKGLRRGEVTVLTGPTGSGKTTYLGQMSLDLAEQDINVLWGSFEIKNTRLMHKLLQQFARKPLPSGDPSLAPQLMAIADRFESLPINFMKFHGGSDVDDVIDAMDYAVYVHDVEHIILDNMQFMVSRNALSGNSNRASPFDKFEVQDVAIEKFRKFATDKNVHITLVVHPRKEQENTYLSISSIYGSAKATQEADLVMILQNDGRRKYLEVKKNRFNGSLGHIPLHYDPKSCRYSEEPHVEGAIKPGAKKSSPPVINDTNHETNLALQNKPQRFTMPNKGIDSKADDYDDDGEDLWAKKFQ